MFKQKVDYKNKKEFEEAILIEKKRGTSDLEIGKKYGVTFKYIEQVITRSQGVNISAFKLHKEIKRFYPEDFKEEHTTVWSFKKRGNWATHSGEYRGNWSPYIPRNVILKYSKPGELVLDYFCGAGTTAIECKLLGRRCIALDINDKAIEIAKRNTSFDIKNDQLFLLGENECNTYEPELFVGDARDLSFLKNSSVDLICSHPPYANIIHYTNSKEGDLSFLDIDDFLVEMLKVAKESYRVLKPGRKCVILIGDLRRKKHVIPLGFKLIDVYLKAGFMLKELVIKRQHNCKTTGFWYKNSIKHNFLLLSHEYLPIFEKPATHTCSIVKEEKIDYNLPVPTSEKPIFKKRLDEFETTTVWLFPEKDFEYILNKNVIDRYSKNRNYSIITFESEGNVSLKDKQKGRDLLFIKSPFLKDIHSCLEVEYYLKQIENIVDQGVPHLNNGGFLVIQTRDVRVNGYIEPLAKKIVDMLKHDNLWLKEIIVVTYENLNSENQKSEEYLKIAHQYLLVYEVKK
ncbi:MAG TPA: DNA methyltransferase [bacterium]|nr:DNA methyltransferase [bacterium]